MSQQPVPLTASQKSIDFLFNFLTGGFAGVVAKTLTAPIERVKLLLQTQSANEKVVRPYKGIVDCFYRIVTEEGAIALWRGNTANVIRYFPTQALNFSFKEIYRDLLIPRKEARNGSTKVVLANLLAGGLAGSTSTLFVYPLDMARTRLGVDVGKGTQERQFKGPFDCIRKIYKADGIKGLYRGIGMALMGIFVYRGLYFGTYDSGKYIVIDPNKSSLLEKFLFAQVCVIVSESISYPTDTIKRRLMLQAAKKEVLYSGAMDCVRKLYKSEGMPGFFKGNLTNIIRSAGSSICLVLYDEIQRYTKRYGTLY